MNSAVNTLSDKLIEVIKHPYFSFNGVQIFDPNFSDYFVISNERNIGSEFTCQITTIEMAADILETSNKKLELPKIDRTLVLGQFYNQTLSNEVSPDKEMFLHYIKVSKHIDQ